MEAARHCRPVRGRTGAAAASDGAGGHGEGGVPCARGVRGGGERVAARRVEGDLEASPGLDPVVGGSEWAGGSGRAVNDGRKLTPWGTRPSIEGQSSAVADTGRTRLRPASRGLAVPNHASCAASVSPVGPALTTSTSTGVRFMVRSLSARAGPDDRPQPRSGLVARTSTDQNPSATGWLSVISTSANPTPVSWAR